MINKVILVGNVGQDPEVRTLETGTKVARVRMATTERIFNRQTQETKEHTEWHTVVLWRGLADVADKYVRKGSQIYIEGSLRSNEWTDKEGAKRYGVEVVANELKMLGRRSSDSSGGAGSGGWPSAGSGSGSGSSGYGQQGGQSVQGSGYGSGAQGAGYGAQGGQGAGSAAQGGSYGGSQGGYQGGAAQTAGGAVHPAAGADAVPVDDPDDLPF